MLSEQENRRGIGRMGKRTHGAGIFYLLESRRSLNPR